MGVFHAFKIVQMVLNRATHPTYFVKALLMYLRFIDGT